VVVLHGGPGAGGSPVDAALKFDPEKYHVNFLFESAGSGDQSRLAVSDEQHNHGNLVVNIERNPVRALGVPDKVDRVSGEAWGCLTLAN